MKKRLFFDKANSIEELIDVIKKQIILITAEQEYILNEAIISLRKIQNTELEKDYIDFIHYVEERIAVTSTKYFRPNYEKHLLTLGTIARAYTDSLDKYKTYTKWQQMLLALFYRDDIEGIKYNVFSKEVMDKLVGQDGPSEIEMKEYREFIFNQIYRTNACKKGQIDFLLTDEVDINKVYDIIGFPPKKRNELTQEEIEKVTDILLTRGPEESPIMEKVSKDYGIMTDLDSVCLGMNQEEILEFVNNHTLEGIEKMSDVLLENNFYI